MSSAIQIKKGYEILDSFWCTCVDGHSIGFVAIQTIGGWKCFVGALDYPTTEENDAQRIVERGGKVVAEKAFALFPRLKPEEYVL